MIASAHWSGRTMTAPFCKSRAGTTASAGTGLCQRDNARRPRLAPASRRDAASLVNSARAEIVDGKRPVSAKIAEPANEKATRRDFLYIMTGVVGAAAVVAVAWPLVDQMNPDESTLAAGGPVDVDLIKVHPGQQILVRWRGKPVFIVNRTPAALKTLQDPKLLDQLADPDSAQRQQPPYADSWHRSTKPEYLIVVGICTHLGCIPQYYPQSGAEGPAPGWLGGYFCPCHGSKYDLAGRVFKGVPAPYNLPVPPYRYVSDTVLRIGENPPGVTFDFASIQAL
jgi:ubiquinol-cytochrome c reductase iron-sulfur subunit